MARKPPEVRELNAQEFEALLARIESGNLTPEDHETVRAVFQAYAYLIDTLENKNTSLARLRKLLFGASTEKTEAVTGNQRDSSSAGDRGQGNPTTSPEAAAAPQGASSSEAQQNEKQEKKPKGHGRNGAAAYTGGETISVPHESLKSGDPCAVCVDGTVYKLSTPGVIVRITGQAPLAATIYELDKLRCNLCGQVFTAELPEEAGEEKYDATVAAMIAMLKYGSGLPFNRIARLQENLGVPIPPSTQWEIIFGQAAKVTPVYQELTRVAAQGELIHSDDTYVKILEHMGKRAQKRALEEGFVEDTFNKDGSPRAGLYTTGMVVSWNGHKIALYFSGRQHAGENLGKLLQERAEELEPPIHMCDALSRNLPAELATIVANCLAHGRRNFVDVHDRFPEACRYVLETLSAVYKNDAEARQQNMSPEERLAFHQAESRPVMDKLLKWLNQQFDDHLVEPNSGLGQAINYMINHWDKLTLFLRKAGAPLDNNVCERALKKAILHRKNSLFYKTERGALVGDIFMSLIYTCELCGVNPHHYLTELLRHASEAKENPSDWLPWNYQLALGAAPQAA